MSVDLSRPADAALDLWDRLIRLAERVGPDGLSLPTPCPDTDIGGLLTHVAGVHRTAGHPHALVDGLRSARAADAALNPSLHSRVLRAACLDLWVHTYDLATAIGEPVDLDEDSPALAGACGYVWDHLPQLVARRSDPAEDTVVRIALSGAAGHDAAVAVRGGRGLWIPAGGAQHTVTAKPGAFVLLLSGRADPEHWRALGALTWSGPPGETFVRNARLPGS